MLAIAVMIIGLLVVYINSQVSIKHCSERNYDVLITFWFTIIDLIIRTILQLFLSKISKLN